MRCLDTAKSQSPEKNIRISLTYAITTWIEGLVIINPIGCSSLTIGKLRCDHLTDNYSTSIDQLLHSNCRLGRRRVEVIPRAITIAGADARDIIDILDAKSDTGKRQCGGLGVVEPRRHSSRDVLTRDVRCENGIGTVAVGEQGLSECANRVGVQAICHVDVAIVAVEEIRSLRNLYLGDGYDSASRDVDFGVLASLDKKDCEMRQ